MREIAFSIGKHAHHAEGLEQIRGTFDELVARVQPNGLAEKDGPYICGPLRRGRRNTESAEPIAFVALDLDRISDDVALAAIMETADRWRGVGYTTFSHKPEAGINKARLIFALDREVTRAEYPRLCQAVAAGLAHLARVPVEIDASCSKPEQPLYTARRGATVWSFDGEPIRVDQALLSVPDEPERASPLAVLRSFDPVLLVLRDQGRLLRDLGGGKFAIRCPFAAEHSREHTADDSSTVYMLPHTNGYQQGHFKCQHDHCAGRQQAEFRQALGIALQTPKRGETGDRGEEPRQTTVSRSPRAGEQGRILGEKDQKALVEAACSRIGGHRPEVPEYPVQALGEMLGDACRAVSEKGQVDAAMAGQSLLAAGALLCQSRANVRSLQGVKPLSLYLLTIALSGDGKSTTDGVATGAIESHQRERSRIYKEQLEEIQSAPRKHRDAPPAVPPRPYILMRDPTIEGVRRDFDEGQPSQGAFSAEAGAVLAGYGMSAEQRIKTASGFDSLWDNGEISVSRSMTKRLQLYDRRLSIHWLVQPDAARGTLHDSALTNVGFWPRFLVAWPEPLPPRRASDFRPDRDPAIGRYWKRCAELLQPLGEDCSGLPVIEFDDDARALLGRFFERMEIEAKTEGGELTSVRAFAVRATEQLARIAGVLAVFDGRDRIDEEHARRAAMLVGYSLETWRSIFGDRDQAQAEGNALLLYGWLLKQRGAFASETAMLRIGPKRLRSRDVRDTALAVLEQHGLVEHEKGYWSALRVES